MSLADVVFPYRSNRQFGMTSWAFIFVVVMVEIELLSYVGFVLAQRGDLFLSFQSLFFPVAAVVSLFTSVVFTLRARAWTRKRLLSIREYDSGASSFGERLAQRGR